jgi:hypothetical protein
MDPSITGIDAKAALQELVTWIEQADKDSIGAIYQSEALARSHKVLKRECGQCDGSSQTVSMDSTQAADVIRREFLRHHQGCKLRRIEFTAEVDYSNGGVIECDANTTYTPSAPR